MNTLLIRAEDKNQWEKRAPITPDDLKAIIEESGAPAFVEKSDKRFFSVSDYEAAGAGVCEGMDKGDLVFGVKEIPEEKILDGKAYVFFSHTIKGQPSGMPLLKKIMSGGSTLIDYEKITDDKGRRLIFFGRYAGDAGAIDILHLMGAHWAAKGIANPFEKIRPAHQYDSVAEARDHVSKIGEEIRENGLPNALSPMVIGVLGYGNVSGGAQQILDCLPTRRIAPSDLEKTMAQEELDSRTVYVSVFKEEDLVVNTAGDPFVLQEYYDHPERFESQFDRYMPCLSLIVNAVYWDKPYPRFVTWDGLKALFEKEENPRLAGIADITCDTHGSIECNVKSTDSGMPAYQVDPLDRSVTDGHTGDGIVVLAVDNLPCEVPNDSSTFFSKQLRPFVTNMLKADYNATLETSGLCPEIQKAVIVYKGELTPDYQYLNKFL